MIAKDISQYVGSKGGAGVYQRIINKIPDSKKILIPFIGSGQIFKRLDHSRSSIYINDYDSGVVANYQASSGIEVFNYDFRKFLELTDTNDCFIYLDPPYLLDTRNGNEYYEFELSEKDHFELIKHLNTTNSMYLLNHPPALQYSQNLLCSSIEEYDYMTRGGLKKDCLWMNYNPADIALNTYAYLGSDFTERQQIKRQLNNIIGKLDKLPFHKRDSIIRDLIAHFNYAVHIEDLNYDGQ